MKDYTAIGRYVLLMGIVWLAALTVRELKDIHGTLIEHSEARIARYEREVGPMMDANLPRRCAVYYGNGTDDWVDCMGVGYVK